MTTLNNKKAEFTRNLLLDAACELTKTTEISDISFKLVSEQARISPRTMFRHFNTRDEFLDALTSREYGQLDLPDIPNSIEQLSDYIVILYHKLEAQPRRVMMLLSADLLPRVVRTSAKARFEAIQDLLAGAFPSCEKSDIIKSAANMRYAMSASSWRYYRINFEFDLETSIECAQMIVAQGLLYLKATIANKKLE